METARKLDRAHQIYKLKSGLRVPGTTTITGVMAKPHLIKWANNLGLQGLDSTKYVDALANAGTLAHYLVECDLNDTKPDQSYLDEFAKVDMDRAENSLLSFYEWQKQHEIETIATEIMLVSERYRYGGTLDAILRIDGKVTLVDLKTSKALYGALDEKWTQLAGYELLAREHYVFEDLPHILRIGRDATEGFEFTPIPDLVLHRQRFQACLALYDVNRRLKRVQI